MANQSATGGAPALTMLVMDRLHAIEGDRTVRLPVTAAERRCRI